MSGKLSVRKQLRSVVFASIVLSLLVFGRCDEGAAQVLHSSGQGVQPVFEGFEANLDGSYTMWFGYMNRNYEEAPHVAVGAENYFQVLEVRSDVGPLRTQQAGVGDVVNPGPADRGQPSHFYPRRQFFMFGVTVPSDWGGKQVTWTVTHNGEMNRAFGTLRPENIWAVDAGIWKANRLPMFSGLAGRTSRDLVNRPPSVEVVGDEKVSTTVGEPVTLTIFASDDGEPGAVKQEGANSIEEMMTLGATPLPNRVPVIGGGTGGAPAQAVAQPSVAHETGLGVTWVHYRGPGEVTFDPMTGPIDPQGGEAVTSARFSEPGIYVIRAYADDGYYMMGANVTVVVEDRMEVGAAGVGRQESRR